MMRRPSAPACAIASCLVLALASPCAASVAPNSIDLGLGVRPASYNTSAVVVPMVGAGWRISPRLSLRSSVAYLREQAPRPVVRIGTSPNGSLPLVTEAPTADRSAHYLPFGAGLRLFLKQNGGTAVRGLFLEAAPTLAVAWLPAPYGYGGHDARILRGVEAALGARFAATDGTRGEIGLRYHSFERATTTAGDLRTFAPYATPERQFHFDALAFYVSFGFGD